MRAELFMLFLFISFFEISLDSNSQVLENYNNRIQELYPNRKSKNNSAIQVNIDIKNFPQSEYRLSIPEESTLFLGEKLWVYTQKDTTLIISLADLKDLVAEANKEEILLGVFKNGISPSDISVEKGFFDNQMGISREETKGEFSPEKREVSNFNDFFFFAVVTVLFLLAVYKMIYPLVLKLILTPSAVFSAEDFSESNSLQKFFSIDILFYLLIVNMLVFLLSMIFIKNLGTGNWVDLVNGDLNQLFLNWLFGSGILVLISVLKFVFLRIIAFVFELGKIVTAHFFYLLRIISILIFGMAFIVSFLVLNDYLEFEQSIKYLLYGFFGIYLFGVGMLFIIMSNRLSFKNYHLFVYICSAEIVPFLILTKVIIG
ncbi:protein of unknown function [Aquiflexum balticum DSM 16537]|uniref:DUF4271 domain-containing protein n=1 Tax=Aquiflexum balticum DSM 16537 TaxID=758820 RepID=A0A1W2H087_9BACT|nr:DUF4271 domain-containing protein [Aquiflexum balticum]SMD42313.1 protein of unknown function [Aquiflexum balticum DSM 16537]